MTLNQTKLTVTELVVEVLAKAEFPAGVTIELCASTLAMSMTSFRRALSQEGTSFKLLQSKYLNELCVQALLADGAKIDNLAIKLGYSERATFERAFKNKFSTTPAKFAELSKIGNREEGHKRLVDIANRIPPLSDSCQQLLQLRTSDSLDLTRVVAIVERDPVFYGRIMGLASRAIYGRTPKNLNDAIGRNLGINTVVNIAISYQLTDALDGYVPRPVLESYTNAFLLAPKLFQLVRKSLVQSIKFDQGNAEQLLILALMGILLLCHNQSIKQQAMLHAISGLTDLSSLNIHAADSFGISVFSASAMILSLWHIDAELIKQINNLDKVSRQCSVGNRQELLMLLMLAKLYRIAIGDQDWDDFDAKAEILGLPDIAIIRAQLLAG